MRRTLVWMALSACIAACGNDGGDGKLSDAGEHATHDDAEVEREAGESSANQDSGTNQTSTDAGAMPGRDAGAGSDAATPRDAGLDAGGSRDSGTMMRSDGGGSDGGGSAGGCAGKAYKLCEDFESATVGALPSGWTYGNDKMSNRPSVVSDQAHSGTKSLRSANQANDQARIAKSLSSLGATASKHWGRVFYRVKSPPTLPTGGVLHNTMVALTRPSGGFNEWRVVDTIMGTAGKHTFILNVPDDSCCGETGYDYTSYDGKWHCAEWYIDVAAQEFQFFYDGTDVKQRARPTGGQSETLTQVVLGWVSYQTTPSPYNQAWLDDLAIDDSRIGCE